LNDKIEPYHVFEITPGRRVWLNTLDLSWTPHTIYSLLEVDVTVPRQAIAEHKESTGESLSFTGYLTFCLARAVDEDKTVQAYLKNRKQFVIFDDVDVAMMNEHTDGAPATRFVRRLVELIESGNGLCEEESHAEQATTKQDR